MTPQTGAHISSVFVPRGIQRFRFVKYNLRRHQLGNVMECESRAYCTKDVILLSDSIIQIPERLKDTF